MYETINQELIKPESGAVLKTIPPITDPIYSRESETPAVQTTNTAPIGNTVATQDNIVGIGLVAGLAVGGYYIFGRKGKRVMGKKNKKNRLALALLVLAGGAGAAYWFFKNQTGATPGGDQQVDPPPPGGDDGPIGDEDVLNPTDAVIPGQVLGDEVYNTPTADRVAYLKEAYRVRYPANVGISSTIDSMQPWDFHVLYNTAVALAQYGSMDAVPGWDSHPESWANLILSATYLKYGLPTL